MLTVIAYDIVDDRRREAVSTLLEDNGLRVNYSVFECELSGTELQQLSERLAQLIDAKKDRILLYRLCAGCRSRKSALGTSSQETAHNGIVIV